LLIYVNIIQCKCTLKKTLMSPLYIYINKVKETNLGRQTFGWWYLWRCSVARHGPVVRASYSLSSEISNDTLISRIKEVDNSMILSFHQCFKTQFLKITYSDFITSFLCTPIWLFRWCHHQMERCSVALKLWNLKY